MKKLLSSALAALLSACIISSIAGCGAANNRNTQTPDQTGTPQGTNIMQENLQGTDPNSAPGKGTQLGGNTNAGSGNNPGAGVPDTDMSIPNGSARKNNTGNIGQGQKMVTGFDGQRADNIRNSLGTIDGASEINAIVNGSTALISYRPVGTGNNVSAIKNAIVNQVKQLDNSITNVVITDSTDMAGKMNQLSNDIKSSKAGNDLTNRFNQLIQSITPKAR